MLYQPKKARRTLNQRLFRSMLILVALLSLALCAGLFLFGRFDSPKEDIGKALELQMNVFENDMTSYWSQLAVMGINLSEDTTELLETYLHERGLTFSSLYGAADEITALQAQLIDPLCEHLRQTACSGAFIVLETSVHTDPASDSRTALYVVSSGRDTPNEDLLLYRGISSVGKANGVMPHRKWQNELHTSGFPNYISLLSRASLPLYTSYRLTDLVTLPGTDEKVILFTIPLMGADGSVYGLCGYQVSQRYFKATHAQPSNFSHMVCLLTPDGDTLNADAGLSCGISNGYYLAPKGSLSIRSGKNGLVSMADSSTSYIGLTKNIMLSCGDSAYQLAVMIPKSDYTATVTRSNLQILLLVLLLLFFSVASCRYFSRRFLSPVLKGLEALKQTDRGKAQSDVTEIADVSSHLFDQDQKHKEALTALEQQASDAKIQIARLAYSRKTEIDPNEYQFFLEKIKALTAREREIFDLYCHGSSIKEVMDLLEIKQSTIKYHNKNIYETLGVKNLKQLTRYVALMQQEQRKNETPESQK